MSTVLTPNLVLTVTRELVAELISAVMERDNTTVKVIIDNSVQLDHGLIQEPAHLRSVEVHLKCVLNHYLFSIEYQVLISSVTIASS